MTLIELDVESVAHGGHCVARHEGRAVFVRHAIPGERVAARVTEGGGDARFWRADAIDVLEASPDRVEPAWDDAGPGRVGAAEFQHIALPAQRGLKQRVLEESFSRFAGRDFPGQVHAAQEDDEVGGWAWRTRIEVVGAPDGRAGMRGHRSETLHPLTSMPLAVPAVERAVMEARIPAGARAVVVAVGQDKGEAVAIEVDGLPWRGRGPDRRDHARRTVTHRVEEGGEAFEYRVPVGGFWQVHRTAPQILLAEVLRRVGDASAVADLYGGVGLFALPLAARGARVATVEADARASKAARRNLHHLPHATVIHGDVRRALRDTEGLADALPGMEAVVLDPPRSGAGRATVEALAATSAHRLVYVACDPVALARDTALLAGHGFSLVDAQAWDLFPMTHHVETVATFERG